MGRESRIEMHREYMGATGLTFSHGADGCGFSVVRPQCNSARRSHQHEPCCASDGGWPSGLAVQAESPNHRKLRRSRAVVVSVSGKGPARPGQVSDEKTNMCKPLQTHRKFSRRRRNRGLDLALGTKGEWGTPSPLSQGAACVWPWWRPVYRWRELLAGAGMEQENLSPRNRRSVEMERRRLPWLREGGPRAADTARGRVPRGTGAGRPV